MFGRLKEYLVQRGLNGTPSTLPKIALLLGTTLNHGCEHPEAEQQETQELFINGMKYNNCQTLDPIQNELRRTMCVDINDQLNHHVTFVTSTRPLEEGEIVDTLVNNNDGSITAVFHIFDSYDTRSNPADTLDNYIDTTIIGQDTFFSERGRTYPPISTSHPSEDDSQVNFDGIQRQLEGINTFQGSHGRHGLIRFRSEERTLSTDDINITERYRNDEAEVSIIDIEF